MNFLGSVLILGMAATPPVIGPIDPVDCNFGEIYAFHPAECRATIRNKSADSIALDIHPEHSGDRASPERIEIPANSAVEVVFHVDVANDAGDIVRFFRLRQLGRDASDVYARALGFGMSALDDPRPSFDFGVFDVASAPAEKTIKLDTHESTSLRIAGIASKPNALDASLEGQGAVHLRLRSDADWGVVDDFVKLSVTGAAQEQVWIAVKGEVRGKVVPTANPIWMGIVPAGAKRIAKFQIKDSTGRELHLGEPVLRDVDGSVKVTGCEPASAECKDVSVQISDRQPAGNTKGRIEFQLPDYSRTLHVTVWGIFQGSMVKRDLAAEKQIKASPPRSPRAPNQPDGLAAASDQASSSDEAANGPLLKWSVNADGGVHGYQVFRADQESGPFVLLNSKTILAATPKDDVSSYQWRDGTASQGKTYWYYIGAVGKDGTKKALSKPQKKVVD